jgi:uncharacterized protein
LSFDGAPHAYAAPLTHAASLTILRPMDTASVIAAIRAKRPEFEARGVTHVYLFGSHARGEAGPGSDVDLFFDHGIDRLTAFGYVGLKHLADDLLPFKVDFIARGSLLPELRDRIEADAQRIF